MAASLNLAAIDLGASGGRVILGRYAGGKLTLEEIHRFEHRPILVPDATAEGRWCWDVIGMWEQIKRGLAAAGRALSGQPLHSIGIDSWGVDYGLIDKQGRLIRPPVAYRDPRTAPHFEKFSKGPDAEAIYSRTGVQFQPFNTVYQLAADAADPEKPLERASCMLMIPQLLAYWLTGQTSAEHTLASTTQMYDSGTRTWAADLAAKVGVPVSILPAVVDAGTPLGGLRQSVAQELGLTTATKVINVATHDTASAVIAAPLASAEAAYLSSGTWSLLGIETTAPITGTAARAANLTNEAGAFGTIRLLKNLNGMWVVQECKRVFAEGGHDYGYGELAELAAAQGQRAAIDLDAPEFFGPGDMPARIRAACEKAGHAVPTTPAQVVRVVFDSLAAGYERAMSELARVAGRPVPSLHIVGGGAKNTLLNKLTAERLKIPITTGPTDGTAVGNLLVQLAAAGEIKGLPEARQVLRASCEISVI